METEESTVLAPTISEKDSAIEMLKRPLEPSMIKQRSINSGKVTLNYIEGHTVIDILNKAFNYNWNFEVVNVYFTKSDRYEKKKYNSKEILYTEEPKSIIIVHGRLTVPNLGIREGFGTKISLGDASTQESTIKSASTDALKKCATLLGIGIELYRDEEPEKEPEIEPLNPDFISQIKALMKELEIQGSEELGPYISKVTDGATSNWTGITNQTAPLVIKALEEERNSR